MKGTMGKAWFFAGSVAPILLSSSYGATVILEQNKDTIPPRPLTVIGVSAARTNVILTFSEALDVTSGQNATNYTFNPGNIAGAEALLDGTGTHVTINTDSALTPNVENTLVIAGIMDLAGNTVATNTTIKFIFSPVSYAENILYDKPIAYYRFEEIGGAVAKNDGSFGGDAMYSFADEIGPREGGNPSSAKGDPGPRPPAFAGFDPRNRTATFDGANEWVDTRGQSLQGRSAFTVECWIRPNRTNDLTGLPGPDRVTLVGQNDAIEFGFITPGAIEVSTARGGVIDVPYLFPDDEWHHVAIVGNGTEIRTYFDGELVATGGNATTNYGNSVYNVHIGGGGGFDVTGNWYAGQLDELAIFDKPIPAPRIIAHYRAGKEGGVITISGAVTPEEPVAETNVSIVLSENTLTISWSPQGGTLESSSTLGSDLWTEVGTENPATVARVTEGTRFFRVRR